LNFPHPIYFVHRGLSDWPELIDGTKLLDPEQCPERFINGRDCWTIQTYLHLKCRGNPVKLVSEFVPGQINFVHYDDLLLKSRPDKAFVVGVQPDRPRPGAVDLRVTQNKLQVQNENDHYMVFWPQPGLRVREAQRGNRIERLGYLGLAIYLGEQFRNDAFKKRLAELGMELVIREAAWTDCTDLDAILAVRQVSEFDLSIKPPSKLINAWRAGMPALLGVEPAYEQLRVSPLDYFQTRTPDDAIAALRRLRDEEGLMAQMIANGQKRCSEFSVDNLATRWETFFSGPVADAYEKWKQEPSVLRLFRFGFRAVEHKRQRRRFFKLIKT
jgi:hypothetical protein